MIRLEYEKNKKGIVYTIEECEEEMAQIKKEGGEIHCKLDIETRKKLDYIMRRNNWNTTEAIEYIISAYYYAVKHDTE